MQQSKQLIYTLGLDIGITSIGWAIVENRINQQTNELTPHRLLHTGVRIFEAAENPKNGGSLAEDRRLARSVRKRLRRRKQRLQDSKKLLQSAGLIQKYDDIEATINYDPYLLREKALETLLSNLELAKVILHIAKRRGFKSSRKDMNLEKEGGKYKKYIEENKNRINKLGYRTAGEMFSKSPDFQNMKRNRYGDYHALITRDMLEHELTVLLNKQRELGNSKLTDTFANKLHQTIFYQRPFARGDDIKKLIGKCTFEEDEVRASKYSVSFETFSLLQKISNTILYSKVTKEEFPIDNKYKKELLELAKTKQKILYKDLRKLLQLTDDVIFSKFRYKRTLPDKNLEDEVYFEMKGYHAIKKAFKNSEQWNTLEDNTLLMDTILQILTVYKTDEDIEKELKEAEVQQEIIDIVLSMPQFSKFGHLSLKALRKLIPLLYTQRYDEAWKQVYPDATGNGTKNSMVPKIPVDEIRNPVVLRALTQMRKVVNAIIQMYGSPAFIHIELAREMSKNFQERKELEKRMDENAAKKTKLIAELQEAGVTNPGGDLIFKYGLWKSQKNDCAYSTRKISFADLQNPNRTQVDHILPYSRSLNDSYDNKVLVFVEENQRKKNRTPLEYLTQEYGQDSGQVRKFKLWVENLDISPLGISNRKKENLLNTDLAEVKLEEYIERDLNDTRYISRFTKNFLEQRLLLNTLPEDLHQKKRRIFTFPGFFTARMRHNFGIPKDRSETNRHHAMDAVILAVSNYSMLKAVSDFYKIKEQVRKVDNPDAPKFIKPWLNFRKDVMARVYDKDISFYSTNLELNSLYDDKVAYLQPLFVSRMVNHKITGAAHEETFYSPKQFEKGIVTSRKRDDKTKKIEIVPKKPSGFFLNSKKTFVQHANMVKLDVYSLEAIYYIVPVYVADIVNKNRIVRAVKTGKSEKDWPVITDKHTFEFSIFPNDYLVLVDSKGKKYEGYYVKFDKTSGQVALLNHDEPDKKKFSRPVITSAKKIVKDSIDILGRKTNKYGIS